jgi:excisionase family DNA binding protein
MFAPDGTLGVEEAAHVCGVSDETIRRRLRKNRLPNAVRDGGPSSPWRIPLTDLVADGLEPKLGSDTDGALYEVAQLKEALEAAERLLTERQARIEELQAHVDDLRSFIADPVVKS